MVFMASIQYVIIINDKVESKVQHHMLNVNKPSSTCFIRLLTSCFFLMRSCSSDFSCSRFFTFNFYQINQRQGIQNLDFQLNFLLRLVEILLLLVYFLYLVDVLIGFVLVLLLLMTKWQVDRVDRGMAGWFAWMWCLSFCAGSTSWWLYVFFRVWRLLRTLAM